MITHILQQDKNCCALACIESLTADQNARKTQAELIKRFSRETSVGRFHDPITKLDKMDGGVDLLHFFRILVALKVAQRFEVGSGKDFVMQHAQAISNGIFLFTTTGRDGAGELYHCLRLQNENKGHPEFSVLDPSENNWRLINWDSPEFLKSVVVVCVP